jgi:hypothetical protein
MKNDLFRLSQQQGIYHTLSLWSRLSPNLVKGEKAPDSQATFKETAPARKSKKKSA